MCVINSLVITFIFHNIFFLLVAMINSNICTMYIYLTYMFGTCVLTEHINPIREKSEAKSIKALNLLGENSTVLSSFFFFFFEAYSSSVGSLYYCIVSMKCQRAPHMIISR